MKYWLEVIFGLVISALTFMVRHHLKLMKESQERHESDLLATIDKKLDDHKKDMKTELSSFDKRLETQKTDMQAQMTVCYTNMTNLIQERENSLMNEDDGIRQDIQSLTGELSSVKNGMLAVQGRAFKEECYRLLRSDHTITITEYENILSEHSVYNALGGNHEGDSIFAMVEAKFQKNLLPSQQN